VPRWQRPATHRHSPSQLIQSCHSYDTTYRVETNVTYFQLVVAPCWSTLFQLLVTADIAPSSPISSSETSVLTRATWRHILEDGILHSHRRENLKSYIALTGWAL
jgi:hypothetical protein